LHGPLQRACPGAGDGAGTIAQTPARPDFTTADLPHARPRHRLSRELPSWGTIVPRGQRPTDAAGGAGHHGHQRCRLDFERGPPQVVPAAVLPSHRRAARLATTVVSSVGSTGWRRATDTRRAAPGCDPPRGRNDWLGHAQLFTKPYFVRTCATLPPRPTPPVVLAATLIPLLAKNEIWRVLSDRDGLWGGGVRG
jgi:hypothetical protein